MPFGDPTWDSAEIVEDPHAPTAVFTDTGQAGTPDQERTVRNLASVGGYSRDPHDAGTSRQPYALRPGEAPPESGFYQGLDGVVHQAGVAPHAGLAPGAVEAEPQHGAPATWDSAEVVEEPTPQEAAYAAARRDSDRGSPEFHAVTNGLTFGLGDVASAAGAFMGQLDENNRERANGVTPELSALDAFKAKYAAERDSQKEWADKHRWENLGLSAGGALLNPVSIAGGEFVSAAPQLGGVVGRSAILGAGTGAVNGYMDGRGDVLDGSRIMGGVVGGAAGAAIGAALPAIGAGGGAAVDAATGRTAAAQAAGMSRADQALAKLGTSVDRLPPISQAAIRAGVKRGRFGDDTAVQEAAKSLPVPVPLSAGQITGDPAQQLTENMILRGSRGAAPARNAQLFRQDQQEALRGNVNQIGADMAGGFPTDRSQAGASVSDALALARRSQQAKVDAAYEAARTAPDPAHLAPSSALTLTTNAAKALTDRFDPLAVPNVAREVKRLDASLTPWRSQLPPGVNPDRVTGLSGDSPADVRSIFDARARLTALQTDPRSPEFAAASAVKKAIDDHIATALTDDLFKGDPKTVELWRNAIGARRDLGRVFQSGDLVQKLTERGADGSELKVDPNDAAKYIFGRSAVGWTGRTNLYRDLGKVRDVLGADSQAWNNLRSAAFGQIARAGDGPMEAGTQQFSGAKFAQAWGKAKADDPNLLQTLFTPAERNTIDTFAGIAARATKPVTGGDNASNSGITAARAIRAMTRLPFWGMESLPFIDHFADKLDTAAATKTIRSATYGAKPRQTPPPVAGQAARWGAPSGAAVFPMLPPRKRADQ